MFPSGTFGSFVFGAGLVVASFTPVQPATHDAGNGYATATSGTGVYAAGTVVTTQTPVPPTPTGHDRSGGYGVPWYGGGVYGSGVVVTSQAPSPPTPSISGGIGRPIPIRAIRGHAFGELQRLTGSAFATTLPWDMTPQGEEELIAVLLD